MASPAGTTLKSSDSASLTSACHNINKFVIVVIILIRIVIFTVRIVALLVVVMVEW